MKKLSCVLLALAMSFSLLAGCSGNSQKEASSQNSAENSSESSSAKAGETTELKIAIWGDEARAAAYKETLAPFCEANNCTVSIDLIPIGDYFDKLASQLGAGTAPDVFWLADAKEAPFIQGDWCVNLREKLESDPDYHLEDFYEDAINSTDYGDGGIYGVPFSFGARGIFYNKTLFEEAGVKTPQECVADGTWTYETMFDLTKQIHEYDSTKIGVKLWCVGQITNGVQNFADILSAYGANLLNEDSTEFVLDSEKGLAVTKMVYDAIYTTGGHAKPGDDTAFVSGNVAMARETYSYMKSMANGDIEFEWDVVPQPYGGEGKNGKLYTGYAYWCANASSKQADLAAELVKYITTSENLLAWCSTFMSPRTSVMESDKIINLGDGYPSADKVKAAFVDSIEERGLFTYRGTSQWTLIQTVVEQNYEMIWAGAVSIEDGVAQMKEDVTALLD